LTPVVYTYLEALRERFGGAKEEVSGGGQEHPVPAAQELGFISTSVIDSGGRSSAARFPPEGRGAFCGTERLFAGAPFGAWDWSIAAVATLFSSRRAKESVDALRRSH